MKIAVTVATGHLGKSCCCTFEKENRFCRYCCFGAQ